jgi:hypothetical protein
MIIDIARTKPARTEARKRALAADRAKAAAACEAAALKLSTIVARAKLWAGEDLLYWDAISSGQKKRLRTGGQDAPALAPEYVASKLASEKAAQTKRKAAARAEFIRGSRKVARTKLEAVATQLKTDVVELRKVASVFRAVRKLGQMTVNAAAATVRLNEIAGRCRTHIPAKDIPALDRISRTLQSSEKLKAIILSRLQDRREGRAWGIERSEPNTSPPGFGDIIP